MGQIDEGVSDSDEYDSEFIMWTLTNVNKINNECLCINCNRILINGMNITEDINDDDDAEDLFGKKQDLRVFWDIDGEKLLADIDWSPMENNDIDGLLNDYKFNIVLKSSYFKLDILSYLSNKTPKFGGIYEYRSPHALFISCVKLSLCR